MLRFALLPAVLVLASCASQSTVPTAAYLSKERLTVDFGNGSFCKGPRAAGQETDSGWTGKLEGCNQTFDYEVQLLPGTNPVRYIFDEGFKALGNDDIIAPLAVIRVTRPDGNVFEFPSPTSIGEDLSD